MKLYIHSFLRSIDYFGAGLKLNLHKKDKYQSSVGGAFSLLMYFILFYFLINGIIQLVRNQNYQVLTKNFSDVSPQEFILSSKNFMFAFQLSCPSYIDQNKITIQASSNNDFKDDDGQVTRIKEIIMLEKCTIDHFTNYDFKDKIKMASQLQQYFCFPKNYNERLVGTHGDGEFRFLKIQIFYEDGSELSEEFLNSDDTFGLQTIIMSQFINFDSESSIEIANSLVSDFYLYTTIQIEQYTDIFLSYNNLRNHDKFSDIAPKSTQDKALQFNISNIRRLNILHRIPTKLFTVFFRLSQSYSEIDIYYQSLSELVSFIGGVFNVLSAVFGVIAISYNQQAFNLELANQLYEFNTLEKSEDGSIQYSFQKFQKFVSQQIAQVKTILANFNRSTKKLIHVSRLLKMSSSPPIQNTKVDCQTEYQKIGDNTLYEIQVNFLDNIFTHYINARRKLQLGLNFLYQFLTNFIKSFKIKHDANLIIQCDKMIRHELDIVIILDKIQQISKLKRVVLSKRQLRLFNFSPRPIVDVQQNIKQVEFNQPNNEEILHWKSKNTVVGDKKRFETKQSLNHLYNTFQKLKITHSDIDERVIELLGESIQQIFECAKQLQDINKGKQQKVTQIIQPDTNELYSPENILKKGKQLQDDSHLIQFQ